MYIYLKRTNLILFRNGIMSGFFISNTYMQVNSGLSNVEGEQIEILIR